MKASRARHLLATFVASLCLLLLACDNQNVKSSVVETADISVHLTASSNGDGSTEVSAWLSTSDANSIYLDLNETLRAKRIDPFTFDERVQAMARRSETRFTTAIYETFFGTDQVDTTFEVAFDRAQGREDAPHSTATLPSPFELEWVSDPTRMSPAPIPFSRSEVTPAYVVWHPSGAPDFIPGDELSYVVTGTCISRFAGTIDWQTSGNSLRLSGVLADLSYGGPNCNLRVEFMLSRAGALDPAFFDGNFIIRQVRMLTLPSIP